MTYTVKQGDTLYGISNQFGVSVTELAKINNVTTNNIKAGQILKIPSNSGTNPDSQFIYTVVKGDSLYNIALRYNTTVKKIIDLNNLKSNDLKIGQKLKIPETYSQNDNLPYYKNYVVKQGDNLYIIAKSNNISVDTIIKDNNLKDNILQINQVLKIRIPISEELECIGNPWNFSENNNEFIYTVKKGDSLYKIANNFGITVSQIVNTNNLKNTNLNIGDKLKIPIKSNEKKYIVKQGDSLYKIAQENNTTVENIKKKNNLKNNLLSIGQILYI